MSELSVPWLRSGTGRTPAEGGCILQVIDWIDRNQWTDHPTCVHRAIARVAIRANDTLPDGERQKLLDLAPRIMGTASDDKKLSVQLAVFSARYVLHFWEEKHPADLRPRRAIEAAEAWLENPTEENHQKAIELAYAASAYASASASAYAYAYADAAYAYADAYAAYAYASAYAYADAVAYASATAYADAVAYASASAYAASAAAHAADADARGAAVYTFLVALLDEYDRLTGRERACHVDLIPAAVAMAGSAVAGRSV